MATILSRAQCVHWFRQWLAAYMAPSHYLKQWWIIVNQTWLGTGLSGILIEIESKLFHWMKWIWIFFLQNDTYFVCLNASILLSMLQPHRIQWITHTSLIYTFLFFWFFYYIHFSQNKQGLQIQSGIFSSFMFHRKLINYAIIIGIKSKLYKYIHVIHPTPDPCIHVIMSLH